MLVSDFNAKLGKDLIKGDVRNISENGKKNFKVFSNLLIWWL